MTNGTENGVNANDASDFSSRVSKSSKYEYMKCE